MASLRIPLSCSLSSFSSMVSFITMSIVVHDHPPQGFRDAEGQQRGKDGPEGGEAGHLFPKATVISHAHPATTTSRAILINWSIIVVILLCQPDDRRLGCPRLVPRPPGLPPDAAGRGVGILAQELHLGVHGELAPEVLVVG